MCIKKKEGKESLKTAGKGTLESLKTAGKGKERSITLSTFRSLKTAGKGTINKQRNKEAKSKRKKRSRYLILHSWREPNSYPRELREFVEVFGIGVLKGALGKIYSTSLPILHILVSFFFSSLTEFLLFL